jgi:ADP-ribose pyrophosphatase YjhB (NUDIX family)
LGREHRISVGAIILHDGKILLVRYIDSRGKTYLVGPGGGTKIGESLPEAVVREAKEETGLEVNPYPCRLLFVEDLLSRRYRMLKVWLLCRLAGGQLEKTRGAEKEGILEVGWYGKSGLAGETVYPPVLMSYDWQSFDSEHWESKYLELRKADF